MKEEVGTAEADAFNALPAAVPIRSSKSAKDSVDNALLTAQGRNMALTDMDMLNSRRYGYGS